MVSDGNCASDAAEVGQALAFPGGLRGQLAALAAGERPVREAARAGWARLDELRVLTAALNGSVAARGGRAGRDGGARNGGGGFAGFDGGDAGGGVVVAVGGEVGPGPGPGVTLPGEVSAEVVRAAAPVAAEEGRTGLGGEAGFAGFDGGDASGGVAAVGSGVGAAVGGAGGGFGGDAGGRDGMALEGRGAAPDALGQRGVTGFPSLARYDDVAVAMRAGDAEGVAPLPAREVDWGAEGKASPVGGAAGGLRADVGRALRERAAGGRVGAMAPGRMAEMAEVVGWAAESERRRGAAASGRRGTGSAGSAGVEGGDGGLMFGGAAVAPMPQERGGDAGGVGTVMLDGRVVGQWLSERMARDAARPGAGTTFFDPRQAPAWTPSGAV